MNWSSIAAQCVMCYRTAAAQQAERARVLNSGIIILLIPPLLVLGLILWMAFRRNTTRLRANGEISRSSVNVSFSTHRD